MNSVRRRRRRPRVRSISFHTFRWVLIREVALTIIAPHYDPDGPAIGALRGKLAFMPTYAIVALVRRRNGGRG